MVVRQLEVTDPDHDLAAHRTRSGMTMGIVHLLHREDAIDQRAELALSDEVRE